MSQELQIKINTILKELRHPTNGYVLSDPSILKNISLLEDGRVQLSLSLGEDRKLQLAVEAQIRTAITKSDLKDVKVKFQFNKVEPSANPQTAGAGGFNPHPLNLGRELGNIKNVIAIASGKGGVGKSTVAINFATALARDGYKVGLLDADMYGPSVGKLVGQVGKTDLKIKNEKIIPIEKYGMKVMSFSFLVEESQAIVWRGPMIGKALEQFLFDIDWGTLDYLVLDLPPGTGDIQLSLAQLTQVTGAIIVTTPQDVAVQDAMRACEMFNIVKIPIIGVVENMSSFVCPHCTKETAIFSAGGGSRVAEKTKTVLLGRIPLNIEIMQASEQGVPITSKEVKKLNFDKKLVEQLSHPFEEMVKTVDAILKKKP